MLTAILNNDSSTAFNEFINHFEQKKETNNDIICKCPSCGKDKLYITIKDNGNGPQIMLNCFHGCDYKDILNAAGLEPKQLYLSKQQRLKRENCSTQRTHIYCSKDGKPLFKKTIYKFFSFWEYNGKQKFPGEKETFWEHYNETTKQYEKGGSCRVLYHLDRLQGNTVYIPEGEKDVETLEKMGFTATTNPGGAAETWNSKKYAEQLAGIKEAYILADNDAAGTKHAEQVANYLTKCGIVCKIIAAATIYPEAQNKWDISDIVAAVGADKAKELLLNAANAAPAHQITAADPAGALPEDEQAEQWADIKPFEKAIDLQPFPLETLPKVLQDYVKAAAAYNSVYPEICILPMFAALSVCLQGKANVIYPGNGHPETLSLYCITIAAPGERKTSTNKLFMKPIKDYEQRYNTIHGSEIKEYNIKHKILENRLNKAIQKAGTTKDNNANEREALQLRADLTELEKEQKHPLNFTLQDVTPEALIDTLNENQERAAIVGDEATLFKILGGAYSGGKGSSGVNFDILLTSYDGEQYKVSRKGSGNIYLKAPIITIGTMIQEQQFMQILENKDFVGKGFLQRFIFSKPRSNVGNIPFYSPKIPSKTAEAYKELIYSLLEKKQLPQPAELTFDKEAVYFIEYYHTEVQKKIRPGGVFSDPLLQEYASKQVAKVMKIAALLHLCEHSEGEPISGRTAMNAVKIGAWLENQAIAALNGEMQTDNERNARRIMKNLIKHIKDQKAKGEQDKAITKSKLLRLCRTINAEGADEALSYLEDMNAIRLTEIKTNGHPKTVILLNPAITDFKF